jgi:hypothetical protein
MTRAAFAALASLLLAGPAFAQDKFPADKHPWMRYKAGTNVKYTMSYDAAGQKQVAEMLYTLSEVSGDGYTLKVVSKALGFEQERTEKESLPEKVGAEKVTVAGKEIACTVWSAKGKRGEKASDTKFWLPEGGAIPVKVTSKTEGEEEAEITATSLKDEASVLGKKLDCVKLAGKLKTAQGEADIILWMTDKVPGGGARMEMVANGGAIKAVMEVAEIKENP